MQKLAGDRSIADMTIRVPHPYEVGMAEKWIKTHSGEFKKGREAVFAIERRSRKRIIGAVGLTIDGENRNAELGYWVGKRYRNMGYATEAAELMLMYGFEELNLNRIHAHHFSRNPASGRVLEKIGMKKEGKLRQHAFKWDSFEDLVLYGILREEYFAGLQS